MMLMMLFSKHIFLSKKWTHMRPAGVRWRPRLYSSSKYRHWLCKVYMWWCVYLDYISHWSIHIRGNTFHYGNTLQSVDSVGRISLCSLKRC